MPKLIAAVVVLLVGAGLTNAQSSDSRKGWGYGFFGVGAAADEGAVAFLHVGIAGDGLIHKGLGAGGEIGYLAPLESGANGAGLFSGNVSYNFGGENVSRKLVPFATGGYSLLFREGSYHGGNLGGGIQYWIQDRVAVRFELRDHVFSRDVSHIVIFRFGVAFR